MIWQEREPQRLLRPLSEVLRERGVPVHQALFVPADSSYSSLGPRSGAPDLSWQHSIQRAWELENALPPRTQARTLRGAGLLQLPLWHNSVQVCCESMWKGKVYAKGIYRM